MSNFNVWRPQKKSDLVIKHFYDDFGWLETMQEVNYYSFPIDRVPLLRKPDKVLVYLKGKLIVQAHPNAGLYFFSAWGKENTPKMRRLLQSLFYQFGQEIQVTSDKNIIYLDFLFADKKGAYERMIVNLTWGGWQESKQRIYPYNQVRTLHVFGGLADVTEWPVIILDDRRFQNEKYRPA